MPTCSVFTCSHDPRRLERLELSLFKQNCQDFEWILLLNGKADYTPRYLHPEKCLIKHYAEKKTIAYYKKLACSLAGGELLVELDHDDELTTDAISSITDSRRSVGWDFAYSNFVELNLNDDGSFTSTTYPEWKVRPFEHYGKLYYSLIAKPCTPANLRRIETTPNHVRVWSNEFYCSLGGHNELMSICDDQDLVCRSYLAGKCHHIDDCLYVYHRDGSNTSLDPAVNRQIQRITHEVGDRYFPTKD